MVGVTTHDYFDQLTDQDVKRGISIEKRNRMFQTFVRNQYSAHLQEILLTLQNEYTNWDETVQRPQIIKEQVVLNIYRFPFVINYICRFCRLSVTDCMHLQPYLAPAHSFEKVKIHSFITFPTTQNRVFIRT